MKKNKYPYIVLSISVMIFLFYFGTIKNTYADDAWRVTSDYNRKNHKVEKGIEGIVDIFSERYTILKVHNDLIANYSYRPIPETTFAIEWALFGQNPFISHFINLLLYILFCILLYLLIEQTFPTVSKFTIILSLFLFISLAIHVEVVAALKNREIILSGIFGLLFLRLAIQSIHQSKFFLIFPALGLLVLAILCKEEGVFYSIWLFAYWLTLFFTKREKAIKSRNKHFLSFFAISILVFIGIYKTTAFFLGNEVSSDWYWENPLFFEHTFFERILITLKSIGFYFHKIIIPKNYCVYYGYDILNIGKNMDSFFFYGIFTLLFVIIGFAYAQKKKNSTLMFSILFFLGAILTISNLIIPLPGIVADRFFFIASIGLVLSIGSFTCSIQNKSLKKIGILLLGIYTLFNWVATQKEVKTWKNYETLYKSDTECCPKSAKIHSLYASTILKKYPNNLKREKEVFKHLDMAESIYPGYPDVLNLKGSLLMQKTDYLSASKMFKRAYEYNPNYELAYFNYGICMLELKKPNKAKKAFLKALDLKENVLDTYVGLCSSLLFNNQWDSAQIVNDVAKIKFGKSSDIDRINYLINEKKYPF